MTDYYDSLNQSVKVVFINKPQKVYANAEYSTTGDFVIIYQREIKTVLPLKDIDHLIIIR